jgi:predicted transcriptional regulator
MSAYRTSRAQFPVLRRFDRLEFVRCLNLGTKFPALRTLLTHARILAQQLVMLEFVQMMLCNDPLSMGPIESEIMELVWRMGKATGQDVYTAMPQRLPYTTLMSAMTRLVDKGVLKREKRGRTFQFEPRFSREEFPKERILRAFSSFLQGSKLTRDALYSSLLDRICPDAETLDKLQRMIDCRRAMDFA